MKIRILPGLLAVALASSLAAADDISGADRILCSSVQATVCLAEGDCEVGAPWSWNIPQFIEIDFKAKMLRTTPASGENRESPFRTYEREEGLVFLQGMEKGRAFSFVIEEATGMASVAVARPGLAVSVFAACTPMPAQAAAAPKGGRN